MAGIRHCLLVNHRVEPDVLAAVLPEPLVPAVHLGQAWVTVVVVRLEKMRPAGLPPAVGVTDDQLLFRAMVELDGRRGAHFLRSEARSGAVAAVASTVSSFNYHRSSVRLAVGADRIGLVPRRRGAVADAVASFDIGAASTELPASSSFARLDEAVTWLADVFDAFQPDGRGGVDVVSVNQDRRPHLAVPATCRFDQLTPGGVLGLHGAVLDSVLMLDRSRVHHHRVSRAHQITAGRS